MRQATARPGAAIRRPHLEGAVTADLPREATAHRAVPPEALPAAMGRPAAAVTAVRQDTVVPQDTADLPRGALAVLLEAGSAVALPASAAAR
jgi:hypothetical protein